MLNSRIRRPLCPRFLEKRWCYPWSPLHKSQGASGKEAHTKKIERKHKSHIPKALIGKNLKEADGKKNV